METDENRSRMQAVKDGFCNAYIFGCEQAQGFPMSELEKRIASEAAWQSYGSGFRHGIIVGIGLATIFVVIVRLWVTRHG